MGKAAFATIDDFLATLPAPQRAALQKVRKSIHAAAPTAEEGFSYGLPAFRLRGKPLVAFGAAAKHCSFFPMSGTTVKNLAQELKAYDTSKGTIRFPASKPLPAGLVRKLVQARLKELEKAPRGKPDLGKAPQAPDPVPATPPADPEIREYLEKLQHPLKPDLLTLRDVILEASPQVREGIKWNSLSFRTTEYFATINVHGPDRLRLILHRGAQARPLPRGGLRIADPAGLLEWLGADRAMVSLSGGQQLAAATPALQRIVREWIRRL